MSAHVIPLRCRDNSDDDCECAREPVHPGEHWCVACDHSHEFTAYCGARDGDCVCSLSPDHDGPCYCEDKPYHAFGSLDA